MSEWAWLDIDGAPRSTKVIVRTAGGWILVASYEPGFLDGQEKDCHGWVAASDKHPPCWTDGGCWHSNDDDEPSDPPTHWIPMPQEPTNA